MNCNCAKSNEYFDAEGGAFNKLNATCSIHSNPDPKIRCKKITPLLPKRKTKQDQAQALEDLRL